MKVFIVGLPDSGKTSVAASLSESLNFKLLNISSWVASSFRPLAEGEHEQHYTEEFQAHFFELFRQDPNMCVKYATDYMRVQGENSNYVIEGITTPKDFIQLFDPQKDIVVFLNRTDNSSYYQDHDNIALPTMKDYCFWASAAGLLTKNRWLEYNFKIPGEDSDQVNILGSKNTVYLVKSINKAIAHLSDKIQEFMVAQ